MRHGGSCLLRIVDPEARYGVCLSRITIVTNKFFRLPDVFYEPKIRTKYVSGRGSPAC